MGWESWSIGGGCLVYLLALFAVRAAFPNVFLELFHEAVMRNRIGKGGSALSTVGWVFSALWGDGVPTHIYIVVGMAHKGNVLIPLL